MAAIARASLIVPCLNKVLASLLQCANGLIGVYGMAVLAYTTAELVTQALLSP